MVDVTDVFAAQRLISDLRQIDGAIETFGANGRIVNLTVVSAEGVTPAEEWAVNTAGMAYPPAMVAAITQFLDQRRSALEDQLTTLGVTGAAAR